jgi:hypothetical protein
MSALPLLASPPVLEGLRVFGNLITSEFMYQRECEVTVRENHLRALEAQERQEHRAAQKELLTLLIKTAKHVFDRKMDYLERSYGQLMKMLGRHQKALLEREAKLDKAMIVAKTHEDRLVVLSELAKVRETLLELEHRATQVHKVMETLVQSIGLSFEGVPLALTLRG